MGNLDANQANKHEVRPQSPSKMANADSTMDDVDEQHLKIFAEQAVLKREIYQRETAGAKAKIAGVHSTVASEAGLSAKAMAALVSKQKAEMIASMK